MVNKVDKIKSSSLNSFFFCLELDIPTMKQPGHKINPYTSTQRHYGVTLVQPGTLY